MKEERDRTSQVSMTYIPQSEGDILLRRLPNGRLQQRSAWFHHLYAHMLIEDVRNGVMPFARIATGKPFSVCLQPDESRASDLVASALPSQYGRGLHGSKDLGEAVCDFVHECAGTIMYYGEAFFEIVYLLDKENKPFGFRLSHIPSYSVARRRGKMIQELPADVASRWNRPEHIELPQSSILRIQLPAYVRRAYWPMMDVLAQASGPGMPEWAMQVGAGLRKGPAYDFSLHHAEQIKAVALATKIIGWDGRQLIYEDTVEHYRWQRFLRFEEFKIRLRDEIIAGLNDAVLRAGQELGFAGTIVLEGVPTLADIERVRAGLMEGSLPFKDVVEPFRWL